MSMNPFARRVAFALLLGPASVALAQDMPAPQPMPQAPPVMPTGPGVPPAPAVVGAEEKLTLPDFVRPGARLIYKMSSVIEPEDQQLQTTATAGTVVLDVVAVTPTRVYVSSGNYSEDPDGSLRYGAGATSVLRSSDVVGSNAYWMPKDVLAKFTTSGPLTVEPLSFQKDGKTFTSTSLTHRGNESIRRTVWDGESGVLLSLQQATGKPLRAVRGQANVSEFQRQNNSMMQFVSSRMRALPWFNAQPPEWARTVRRMQYQGGYTMSMQGMAPMTIPVRRTVEITDRGDGWAAGKATDQYQNVPQASESAFVCGPASCDGYWIAPQALAALQPGVLDQEPAVGSTMTYEVKDGPMGRAGVFTETNAAGSYRLQRAYRLQDGALVYSSLVDAKQGRTTEFSLAGME